MADEKKKFVLAILLFDDVEVLDFCGPFEVFSIGGERFDGIFKVILVADKKMVTARNGLKVVPDYVIGETIPDFNILLVPGGMGTVETSKNPLFINWMKSVEPKLDYIISVCTGVSMLGKAGFVDDMVITTHHLAYDFVQADCPKSRMCKCRRFIDNERIFTSAGISAGIDVSFYFVKKIFGKDTANGIAQMMEYDWKDMDISTCVCKW